MANTYPEPSTSTSTPRRQVPMQNQMRNARSFENTRTAGTVRRVPDPKTAAITTPATIGHTSSRRKPVPVYGVNTAQSSALKPENTGAKPTRSTSSTYEAKFSTPAPQRSTSGPPMTSTTRKSHSNVNMRDQFSTPPSNSSVPKSPPAQLSNVVETLVASGSVSRSTSATSPKAASPSRPRTSPSVSKPSVTSPTLSSHSSLSSLLAPRGVGSPHGNPSSPTANFQQSPTGYSPGGYASDTSQALSIDMKRLWSKPAAPGSDSERERERERVRRVRQCSEGSNSDSAVMITARATTVPPPSSLSKVTNSRHDHLSPPASVHTDRSKSPANSAGSRSQSYSSSSRRAVPSQRGAESNDIYQHQTPTKSSTSASKPTTASGSVSKGTRQLMDFLADGPPEPLSPPVMDSSVKSNDKKLRNVLRRRPSAKGPSDSATSNKGFSLSPLHSSTISQGVRSPISPSFNLTAKNVPPEVGLARSGQKSQPPAALKIDPKLRPPASQHAHTSPSSSTSNLTPARAVAEAYKQQEHRRSVMHTVLHSETDVDVSGGSSSQLGRRHSSSEDSESQYAVYQGVKLTPSPGGKLVAVGGPESGQYKPPAVWTTTPPHDRSGENSEADMSKTSKSRGLGRKISMSFSGWKGKDRGEESGDGAKKGLQERRSRQSLQERRSTSGKSNSKNSKASSSKTSPSVYEQNMASRLVQESKKRRSLRLSLGDATVLHATSAPESTPSSRVFPPSPSVRGKMPETPSHSRRSDKTHRPEIPHSNSDITPPSNGGGGKLWSLMKRLSTGGLRDKYRDEKAPPPVPELPQQYRNSPRTNEHAVRANVNISGPKSNDGHGPPEDGGLVARFMQSRPSLSISHPNLSSSSSRHTTLPPLPTRPSTNTNATARSASPNSSDVASSKFFHRTQSARSSTSSYGEAPPVPDTHIGNHIIPPRELYRLNGEYNGADSLWNDDKDSSFALAATLTIEKKLPSVPPQLEWENNHDDDDDDWFGRSPVEVRPSLPHPPRRARKPHHTFSDDEEDVLTRNTDSPAIPDFSTDAPINTFGFGSRLRSVADAHADEHGTNTTGNSSPGKVRPSLAGLRIGVPPPGESVEPRPQISSNASYLLPLSDVDIRSPPPRPSRSALRPSPSAGSSSASSSRSSASNHARPSASSTPTMSTPAMRYRHAIGSSFDEERSEEAVPNGTSPHGRAIRNTMKVLKRKSSATLSFASASTLRARPRSNSLGSLSRLSMGHSRNESSSRQNESRTPGGPMTEQQKADIWNDLLQRSDRAPGGTLHLGTGGLLSDQLSLRMSEFSVDD